MDWDPNGIQRRVAGQHDFRLDGMRDLLWRADGASVFDIGCNRGMVGVDFAHHGARLVHGCDIYEKGIETAREIFADIRWCESQFEVVDLRGGQKSLDAFGGRSYDITVCLATYHKLKRVMEPTDLSLLMQYFGTTTKRYFAWRATSDKPAENDAEITQLDRDLGAVGLTRIHTSYISQELDVCAIWSRFK